MLFAVACGAEVTVPVEEADEVEDTEDEEFVLWMDFRGANMPRTSSGFIVLSACPPLTPHAGRFKLAKLWGFATAVMGKSGFGKGWGKIQEEGEGADRGRWVAIEGRSSPLSRVSQGEWY